MHVLIIFCVLLYVAGQLEVTVQIAPDYPDSEWNQHTHWHITHTELIKRTQRVIHMHQFTC